MTKGKVLFTATVVRKHIMEFHLPYLKWLHEQGYEVWVAARNDYENPSDCHIPYCDHYVDVPFARNPFSKENHQALKMLKELIDKEDFKLIHTHTPVGSVLTRLAAKNARKKGTIVIYTAHGFHFYHGASWKRWLIYYPVEKYCSRFEDCQITINQEDYNLAKKKWHCKDVEIVNGVGISFEGRDHYPAFVREENGLKENDFVLVTVAELNIEKNQKRIMDAVRILKDQGIKVQYLLVGDGKLLTEYRNYAASSGISDQVHFLGYRKDVFSILKASDVFAFPSLREGMPVSLMEAMYCGLPCIVNDTRGCRDLIINNKGGFVLQDDAKAYAEKIAWLMQHPCNNFGSYNMKAVEKYELPNVLPQYFAIYQKYGIG